MERLIPTNCKNKATINYSILKLFKSANIYRFFCVSLYRDDYYHARVTLNELKSITGDKTLSGFNDKFREHFECNTYRINKSKTMKPRRNVYHIPPIEPQHITLSRRFIAIDLDTTTKGFFIQLILLSQFANIEMTKPNIIKELRIDKSTYDKYLSDLLSKFVFMNDGYLTLYTEDILLENDFKGQMKLATRHLIGKNPPNVTLCFDKEE